MLRRKGPRAPPKTVILMNSSTRLLPLLVVLVVLVGCASTPEQDAAEPAAWYLGTWAFSEAASERLNKGNAKWADHRDEFKKGYLTLQVTDQNVSLTESQDPEGGEFKILSATPVSETEVRLELRALEPFKMVLVKDGPGLYIADESGIKAGFVRKAR